MSRECAAPLALSALLEYWLDEQEPDAQERLEEHLLACAHCSARLEELVGLGTGIRKAFRSGTVLAVLPAGFLEQLAREGLRLREYRVAPGGSVNCTIAAEDDFVLSRLQAPLRGVGRLDLVVMGPDATAEARFEDIPFDAGASEVVVLPPAAALRAMPAQTQRMRLEAVGEAGERILIGEYTFIHTPS